MSALFEIPGARARRRSQGAVAVAPSRAAHAVARSIANRVAIQALNFATGTLTARALHPAGRGQLAAMILWPLFLANATALGTPSALIYHLRRHLHKTPESRPRLVATGLTMATLLGVAAAGFGALALPHWLHEYPASIARWAQLFLIFAPLWAIQITGQAALEAMEFFSLSNRVQMAIPVSTLTGLLVCAALHRLTPVTAAFSYTFAIVPTAAAIVALLWWHRILRGLSFSVAACRSLLGYGIRSAPLDLLGTLALYLDQVLVVGLLSARAMGSYTVVLSLSRAMLVFQAAVVMVLFPRAAGRAKEEIVDMVGRPVRINTILTGAAAMAVCLVGPLLLRTVYGAEYLYAVPALRVLMCEVVVQGGVAVMSQAFLADGRPGIVSLLQGTGLALAVPLMFALIPRYGVTGAAVSLLLSTCARFLFIFFSFRVFLKTKLPRVVPGPGDMQTLWTLARERIRPA